MECAWLLRGLSGQDLSDLQTDPTSKDLCDLRHSELLTILQCLATSSVSSSPQY